MIDLRFPAAILATFLLLALICFQAALAAGLPLGQFAWGGRHVGALPITLRWGSLAAAGILAIAIWIVLARAGMARPGPRPAAIRVTAWLFAGFLMLNTLGNLVSQSRLERLVMTPVSLTLAACVFVVASSPWKSTDSSER